MKSERGAMRVYDPFESGRVPCQFPGVVAAADYGEAVGKLVGGK